LKVRNVIERKFHSFKYLDEKEQKLCVRIIYEDIIKAQTYNDELSVKKMLM
jgi:hypothetical protein